MGTWLGCSNLWFGFATSPTSDPVSGAWSARIEHFVKIFAASGCVSWISICACRSCQSLFQSVSQGLEVEFPELLLAACAFSSSSHEEVGCLSCWGRLSPPEVCREAGKGPHTFASPVCHISPSSFYSEAIGCSSWRWSAPHPQDNCIWPRHDLGGGGLSYFFPFNAAVNTRPDSPPPSLFGCQSPQISDAQAGAWAEYPLEEGREDHDPRQGSHANADAARNGRGKLTDSFLLNLFYRSP